MDVPEIKDQEHLEAWLKTRSREECIAIAHRAAMRVAPIWIGRVRFTAKSLKRGLTEVVFFRSLQISGVAAVSPTPEIADATFFAHSAAVVAAHSRADVAVDAATDAAAAFFAAAADFAAATADAAAYSAAYAAAAAAEEIWEAVWQDLNAVQVGSDPLTLPLWHEAENAFEDHWTRARADLTALGNDWDFWVRWYEAALRGQPLNWKMQEEIALIPPKVWEGDVAGLAAAIAAIEVKYAIAATPNAERIVINPKTGLLRAEIVSSLRPDYLGNVLDTLRDAVAIFDNGIGGNDPYAMIRPECDLVRDACDRYPDRPIMLIRVCRRVMQRVDAKVQSGECPKNDALVDDFGASVGGVIGDLMAFDEDVREAETARLAHYPAKLEPETIVGWTNAADHSATISEGDLKAELPAVVRLIETTTNESDRQLAIYETKSRLLRIYALLNENRKVALVKGKAVVDHVERYPLVYGSLVAILTTLLL